MVSSLQSIVLYSVPIAILFETLKTLWHLPMRQDCLRALFRRCTHEELRDWAKTVPWDHPVARKLDKLDSIGPRGFGFQPVRVDFF